MRCQDQNGQRWADISDSLTMYADATAARSSRCSASWKPRDRREGSYEIDQARDAGYGIRSSSEPDRVGQDGDERKGTP